MKTSLRLWAVCALGAAAASVLAADATTLKARAAAYRHGTLEDLGLDPLDGINAGEAEKIAEWLILGTVNLKRKVSGLLSYGPPVSDGLNWRIEVVHDPALPIYGPLYISKLSGRQSGRGWGNSGGGPLTAVGGASCYINDHGAATATVRLKRRTAENDFAGRAELLVATYEVVARLNAANAQLEPVRPEDIHVHHGPVFHAPPGADHAWSASITLRLRPTRN